MLVLVWGIAGTPLRPLRHPGRQVNPPSGQARGGSKGRGGTARIAQRTIQRVVVSGHAGVVDVLEAHDDGVQDGALAARWAERGGQHAALVPGSRPRQNALPGRSSPTWSTLTTFPVWLYQ